MSERIEDFYVSATQVSTAELCQRKWAWRYIDKIKAPPNKFATLGIETHGHLEKWLRAGVVPSGNEKEALLAQALIPHLPPPQAVNPANVEKAQIYSFPSYDVHFNMVVDLFMPNGTDGIPRVYDHKTGSNPDYWLTPESLPEDVQASLYAGWGMHSTGSPVVDLQWNYVRTRGSIMTRSVIARVGGSQIEERLGRSIETGQRLRVVQESGAKAIDVQYDSTGCSAYGGCPYIERCNLQPADKLRSIMAMNPSTQTFMSQLSAPPNGQSTQQPQQFAQSPMPVPQQQFAQSPMPVTQQQFAPPPQQQFAPPPQQQFAPPPQQQFAPPPQQQLPQINPPPTFAPPPVPQQAPPVAEAEPVKTRGAGRPAKITKDDPWVAFVCAAMPLLAQGFQPEQIANLADKFVDERSRRD